MFKFQKYKLIFFISFCFVFLFLINHARAVKFEARYNCTGVGEAERCWCECVGDGSSETLTEPISSFEDCKRACDSLAAQYTAAEEAEKAGKKEEKAAPAVCVPSAECKARYQELVSKGGILSKLTVDCYCCGNCGLNDIVNLFIGAANYLFGIVGALALLFFVYGGVLWLTAGGNAEQIEKGKKVLTGAVIGLIIVFGAWLIVQFVMTALGVKGTFMEQFLKTR
jgi:hypothetical protein